MISAVNLEVSPSTQRQALNAIMFLYREVLHIPMEGKIAHSRAKKRTNTVTVLSREEATRLFRHMDGTHALMAKILYGSGLRLMECIRLRIKDIDFDRKRIHVLGKGNKWRRSKPCIIPTWKKDLARSISLLPYLTSTLMLPGKQFGNTFSLQKKDPSTPDQKKNDATMLWNRACKKL